MEGTHMRSWRAPELYSFSLSLLLAEPCGLVGLNLALGSDRTMS